MPDAPENRASAARRVARETCRVRSNIWGRWAHLEKCTSCDAIAAALLAFPGGDAEPVAWQTTRLGARTRPRIVEHIGGRKQEAERQAASINLNWPGSGARAEPLYAAPGAGEAVRAAVSECIEIAAQCGGTTSDVANDIRERFSASLAPVAGEAGALRRETRGLHAQITDACRTGWGDAFAIDLALRKMREEMERSLKGFPFGEGTKFNLRWSIERAAVAPGDKKAPE